MLEDICEKDTGPVLIKKIFLMEKLMFCGRAHINALLFYLPYFRISVSERFFINGKGIYCFVAVVVVVVVFLFSR